MNAQSVDTRFIYVGTFTGVDDHGGGAEGIYVCRMDMTTGAVELVHTVPDVPNPSFLTLHPERPLLYAVNAVPEIDGHAGGTVSAFAVDRTTGALTFLNRQPSQGPGPCHVSVEQTGRYVIAANYLGGSVAMLPIAEDGSLGPATDWVQHEGSSVNSNRQGEPHGHSFTPDPANKYALACDLGLDQVLVYRLDLEHGKLPPNDRHSLPCIPAPGPAILTFIPTAASSMLSMRSATRFRSLPTTKVGASWKSCRLFLRYRRTLGKPATLPTYTFTPQEGSCTARIAGTTALSSMALTKQMAHSLWLGINLRWARRRAIL